MIKGNLWQAFKRLTAKPAAQLATVQSIGSDAITVQFENGQLADVKKASGYSAGDAVFVIGDEIDRPAPSLNYFEFEV